MIPIQGGEVVLRDYRIKREWKVAVKPFLIARCPVTCEQYTVITRQGHAASQDGSTPSGDDADKNKPMVNVSWLEAVAFCNTLSRMAGLQRCYTISDDGEDVAVDWDADGYRLPTEAEWEFSCRAGDARLRYGDLDAIAWYRGNSNNTIHEVGQKAPNAWGLHDMIGNVWEWCWDLYDKEVYGSYRIFRGGGWFDQHWGCTASSRRRSHPTFQIDDLGFRLARTPPR
ncbi:formylglycine-generating enzyme family protein [Cystobacter fuscus]|nr:formylglycine-generating enzyme family protein [Cystobacter fuscus]